MANLLVEKESLEDIADAIRARNGSSTTYKPSEMAGAISAIPSGGITPTGTKNITTNGDHDVTQYATAHVDVPTGITPSGSQEFTQNGTYDVTSLAQAVVNVQASGGGGFELLTEVTITEPVEAVIISFTSDMDGYDCYAMTIDGTWQKESGAGASIFSPAINGSTSKPFSGIESGGEIHRKFMVARTNNPNGTLQNYRLCVGLNQMDATTLTSFDFRWYNTGHTFKAGTVCRIYGAKIS